MASLGVECVPILRWIGCSSSCSSNATPTNTRSSCSSSGSTFARYSSAASDRVEDAYEARVPTPVPPAASALSAETHRKCFFRRRCVDRRVKRHARIKRDRRIRSCRVPAGPSLCRARSRSVHRLLAAEDAIRLAQPAHRLVEKHERLRSLERNLSESHRANPLRDVERLVPALLSRDGLFMTPTTDAISGVLKPTRRSSDHTLGASPAGSNSKAATRLLRDVGETRSETPVRYRSSDRNICAAASWLPSGVRVIWVWTFDRIRRTICPLYDAAPLRHPHRLSLVAARELFERIDAAATQPTRACHRASEAPSPRGRAR